MLLGLSGGIDFGVTAVVAADALGPDKVRAVMMPSPFTSQESLEDAAEVAKLLGIRLDSVSIEPAMAAFDGMLKPVFDDLPRDIAEENIQARARGVTLMALSNKFGPMVLSTGNKSEMSVGYATLYGDMCGGYSVLKDVYKTDGLRAPRWRNHHFADGARGPARPRHPRARHHQVADRRAEAEPDRPGHAAALRHARRHSAQPSSRMRLRVEEIVARGHYRATVARVWRMLDLAEYKRRQAPPGVKITRRCLWPRPPLSDHQRLPRR